MLITNLYMMISFKTLIVTRISFSYFCDDRQGCKETSLRQHFCQMCSGATCSLSPVPEVPGSSSETLQQSKLTFSKSHLLVTFSWKVGTMKKKFRQKKKKEKHNIQGRTFCMLHEGPLYCVVCNTFKLLRLTAREREGRDSNVWY